MNWKHYKSLIIEQGQLEEDWYILGIDLGTTNSVVSYWNNKMKRPEPIDVSNGFGKIPMPSIVQYRKEEDMEVEWIIGEEARQTMKIYPETTVSSVKRHMGTDWEVALGSSTYRPEEVSAMILKELVEHVRNINPKMTLAGLVVSVPYDFDDAAKKATIKACQLAGLSDSLICLIEEPKAAALSYNFRYDLKEEEKVVVFDFGGGTLDITAFKVDHKDEAAIHLKVISEGGEAYHGGDNVDELVYDQLVKWLVGKTGQPIEELTKETIAELAGRARETKERLSGVLKYRIPYTFCIPPFVQPITRDIFEQQIDDFIQKTKFLVKETLKNGYEGEIQPSDIDRILLEGGSAQMPWVRQMLVEIFGDEDKIYVSEQPALDISIGATYYAAMKLGILEHKDLHTLDRDVKFEVPVPHDIGFEIDYNSEKTFYPMIRRGTPYSLAKKSMVFTLTGLSEEEMTSLDLKILERLKKEDQLEDCKLIGDVLIDGLPKRPSGRTKLEVTLAIDEMGGTVEGAVVDLGYGQDYLASGFKKSFSPTRNERRVINVS